MNHKFTNKSILNFLLYSGVFLLLFVNILVFMFRGDQSFNAKFGSNTWILCKVISVIAFSYLIFFICRIYYFSDSYLNFDKESLEINVLNFNNKMTKTSLKYEDITKIELCYKNYRRSDEHSFKIFTNSGITLISEEIWQNMWKVKEIIATFQEIKETKNLNYEIKTNIFFYIYEVVSKIAITVFLVFLIISLSNNFT